MARTGELSIGRVGNREILGVGRSRFFALLEQYRRDPGKFSLAYRREIPPRLPGSVENVR